MLDINVQVQIKCNIEKLKAFIALRPFKAFLLNSKD